MSTYRLKDFVDPIAITVQDPANSGFERFVGLEHYDSNELVIKRFSGVELLTTNAKAFQKNDLLIARRNVYLRRAGVVYFDGITSGDSIVLRVKEDCEKQTGISRELAQRVLPLVLNTDRFWIYANKHADGMNSKRISKDTLLDYEFDLPSIEEQKVLADKLWAAYKVKESYRQLLATTDEMLKAKFQEMFGKEPTMTLGKLAESWSKGQAFKKDEIVDGGKTPCIHYGQLYQYGAVIENILSFTDADAVRTSKIGDILFPASDVTPKGLARCSCINKDGVILGGDIIIMHPLEGLNSSYLSYAINQQTQQLLALVTGSVVRHMSAKSLQTVRVPVPEKEDQQQFAEIATQAEATKASLRASIKAIDRVIRSLINQ